MDNNLGLPAQPHKKPLFRLLVLYFLVFFCGGLLGFIFRPYLDKSSPGLSALLDSESQTKLSLKTLHDKLDQVNTLQTSIETLDHSVNQLDRTVSLLSDTSTLSPPDVLGTTSADLIGPLPTDIPSPDPSIPPASNPVTLNTQKTLETNLYEKPALTSRVVGTWPNGQTAVTVDFQNGWYLVKLDNNLLGWVSAQLVSSL